MFIMLLKYFVMIDMIIGDIMKLKCGCSITEKGEYVLSKSCASCRECNAISKMHPFGKKRIMDITLGEPF